MLTISSKLLLTISAATGILVGYFGYEPYPGTAGAGRPLEPAKLKSSGSVGNGQGNHGPLSGLAPGPLPKAIPGEGFSAPYPVNRSLFGIRNPLSGLGSQTTYRLRNASSSEAVSDSYPVGDFELVLAIRWEEAGAVLQSGDPGLRGAWRISIAEDGRVELEWKDGDWQKLRAGPLAQNTTGSVLIRRIGDRVWMALGEDAPAEASMAPLLSGSAVYAGRLPGRTGLPSMVGSVKVETWSPRPNLGSPPRSRAEAADKARLRSLLDAAAKTKADPKSAELCKQAIELAKSHFGVWSKEEAEATSLLSVCLFNQNKDAEAAEVLRKAVSLSEAAFGVGSLQSGKDLRLLGGILAIQKRYVEAEPLLRHAKRIHDTKKATSDIEYAHMLHNLGLALREQGQPDKGEPFFRESLKLKERLVGKHHSEWASTASALGWCLHQMGNDKEAEKVLAEALASREKAKDRDERSIALLKQRLAIVRGDEDAILDAVTNRLIELPPIQHESVTSFPPQPAAPALRLTPDVEIRHLTQAQYTGLISAVVEALRMVYGDMSPEEEAAFAAHWAPYYEYPSPEVISYLEKLLPLLDRYLQVRGALAEALIAFDQAQFEVAVCAGMDDGEGVLEALEVKYLQSQAIKSLLVELEDIRQAIEALGDPPDPKAQKEEARKRFKSLLTEVQKLLPSLTVKPTKARAQTNKKVVLTPVGKNLPQGVKVTWQFSDGKTVTGTLQPIGRIFDKPGTYTGTVTATDPKTNKAIAKATTTITVTETPVAAGVWKLEKIDKRDDRGELGYNLAAHQVQIEDNSVSQTAAVFGGEYTGGGNYTRITTASWSVPPSTIAPNVPIELRLTIEDKLTGPFMLLRDDVDEMAVEAILGNRGGGRASVEIRLTVDSPYVGMSPSEKRFEEDGFSHYLVGSIGTETSDEKWYRVKHNNNRVLEGVISDQVSPKLTLPPAAPGTRFRIQVTASDGTWQWAGVAGKPLQVRRHYVYVFTGEGKEEEVEVHEDSLEEAEARANREQIEFHQNNIAYFQDLIRSLERQLQDAKDPSARESIEWHLMCTRSNIQGELDAIERLKTGEWVRNRTEFDSYCLQRMAQQGREMGREWAEISRLQAAVPRLLDMLPEDQRKDLRAFVDRHLNRETIASRDLQQMRKAVQLLGERVQAHWSGVAAKHQEEADIANYCLEKAQEVKAVADTAMFVTSFGGGGLVYSAYMGATGYIEGGPRQALKQGIASLGQIGYIAVTAGDGYERSGIMGMAWDAAKAAAVAFGLKLAMGSLTGSMARKNKGTAPNPSKGPPVQQLVEESRFRAEVANGRALVNLFRKRMEKLAEAGRTGASRETVEKLRREAESAAAAIKSSFAAKIELNRVVRDGDSKLGHWYRSHERQINGKVKRELEEIMRREGWSPQQIKEFRNASSSGRASMDTDIGPVEPPRFVLRDGKPVINPEYTNWRRNLTQNGQPRTPQEFQEAGQKYLEEAYRRVTGRSPDQAFLNFTTSGHPEAYKDLAWLGRKGERSVHISTVDPKWASQAGEVSKFKVSSLGKEHPSLGHYAALQENCRGLVKELDSKLGNELSRMPAPQRQYLQQLRAVMNDFAENRIGPLEAEQRLHLLTGGRGVGHVAEVIGSLMHAGAIRRR